MGRYGNFTGFSTWAIQDYQGGGISTRLGNYLAITPSCISRPLPHHEQGSHTQTAPFFDAGVICVEWCCCFGDLARSLRLSGIAVLAA